jgi:hypothetical protein
MEQLPSSKVCWLGKHKTNKELKKSRGNNKVGGTHTHMRLYTSIEWKLVIEVSIDWWRRFLLVSFVIQMGLYRVVGFGFCVAFTSVAHFEVEDELEVIQGC